MTLEVDAAAGVAGADELGHGPAELERGVFLVSIDTELAWGAAHRRHDGDEAVRGRQAGYEREREVVGQVLDLFHRYEIPGTWAMVGHLFLDGCEPGPDGRPHPDQPRPDYDWLGGDDWYAVDPCSAAPAAPTWYAPDLVELIASCPTRQEIASHGFTHMIAGDPGCSREAFAAELAASHVAATRHGVALRSFVYPRNQIGHLDALHAAGFAAYRGGRPAPFTGVPSGWRRTLSAAVDRVRPLAGSAVRPAREPSGLWNLPQTYYFAPASARRRTPPALWARRARSRLRQAVRHRALFHLWFHPSDVTADPARALACLSRICATAAHHRDQGRLATLTMSQLTTQLSAR